MSDYFTRDAFLASASRKYSELRLAGGIIRLREMTGEERDEWEASNVETKKGQQKLNATNFRARLIQRCVVNEDNELMFAKIDIPQIGKLGASVVQEIFMACTELNGITKEDVEEQAGDFDNGPSELSTSG